MGFAAFDKPDAGLWEFRTRTSVHTYSSLMCWAACDRLANIADSLGLDEAAHHWSTRPGIRAAIEQRSWVAEEGRFAATFGGRELDASLLQMVDIRFLDPADPEFRATLDAVERGLRQGEHMLVARTRDDFGLPKRI